MKRRSEKFILFFLGGEQYAFPALSGNQFIEFENPTLIPKIDKMIKGLIYHNGNIITIIDTKKLLKIKAVKNNNNLMCLIFEVGGYHYGILVDQGAETLGAEKIFNDRQKKVFRRYFKIENKVNGAAREGGLGHKKKVYILEIEDILSQINIYD